MSRNNTTGKVKKVELKTQEDITTICYGHMDKWNNRAEAVKYFFECASCSEGAEKERYVNIMMELMAGANLATDGSSYGER